MYETHRTGLYRPSWDREMEFQLSHHEILTYWAGIPNQHRQTNRLYRRMQIGATQRELLGVAASDSWRSATAAFLTQNGLAATTPRCFSTEPTLGTRATTVCGGFWEDQHEHDYGWGIFGALFG